MSIFSKLLDFFTSGGVKTTLTSVLSKAIPLALSVAVATGVFDNLISKLTNGAFGTKDANDTLTAENAEGKEVRLKLDENGNPITDENGDFISVDGEVISSDTKISTNKSLSNMSAAKRYMYNAVRGTITGKGSLLGATIKGNALVKSKIAKNTGKKMGSIIKAATDAGAMDDLLSVLIDNTNTFIKALGHVPILKRFVNASKLTDLAGSIIEAIRVNLTKAGNVAKTTKGILTKLALPLTIATAIMDFTTGWQDASTILKIQPEDVELHHKIICGLVRSFKNLIPVVGTFIPDRVITDIFINHVANWFGIDVSEIKKKQDKAKKDMEEAGYDSWTDYNKIENDQYTWTERLTNKVSSFFKNRSNTYKSTAVNTPSYAASSGYSTSIGVSGSNSYAAAYAKGSGLYGRGSSEHDHQIEDPQLFISQLDPRYRNKRFNIAGDSQVQTIGDSGCAPAAAAMAINGTIGRASIEDTSKLALKYKVKDDGVRASYFDEEFSRHGLNAEYTSSSNDIKNQLMSNNNVVLMGQDRNNTSKVDSPFGPNPHYVTATGMSRDGKYVWNRSDRAGSPVTFG